MRKFILILFFVCLTTVLDAQYKSSYGWSFNNPCSAMMNTFINSNLNQQVLYEKIMKQQNAKKTAATQENQTPPVSQPEFDFSQTCFKGSGGHTVPEILAKSTAGISEAEKKQLIVSFGQAIDEFEKNVTTKNCVPYSLTFLLATSLKVQKGIDLADDDAETLAQEIHAEIVGGPGWAKLSEGEKQQLHETALVNASIMIGLFQSNEEASLKLAKEQAQTFLTLFGIKD